MKITSPKNSRPLFTPDSSPPNPQPQTDGERGPQGGLVWIPVENGAESTAIVTDHSYR